MSSALRETSLGFASLTASRMWLSASATTGLRMPSILGVVGASRKRPIAVVFSRPLRGIGMSPRPAARNVCVASVDRSSSTLRPTPFGAAAVRPKIAPAAVPKRPPKISPPIMLPALSSAERVRCVLWRKASCTPTPAAVERPTPTKPLNAPAARPALVRGPTTGRKVVGSATAATVEASHSGRGPSRRLPRMTPSRSISRRICSMSAGELALANRSP